MRTYKLVNKIPVRCDYDNLMSDSDRVVAKNHFGESTVSTVFLTWDHSFGDNETPILFETMVFGGEYNDYQERYESYSDALDGHQRICDMVDRLSQERNKKLNNLGL